MDKAEFGYRLTHSRAIKKMTRQQVANRANISLSALAAYERGENAPPIDVTERLANILDVSLDWLTGRETNEKDNSLKTWEEIINNMAILTADTPQIKVRLREDYYHKIDGNWERDTEILWDWQQDESHRVEQKCVIELPNFFPLDVAELIERLLPLYQKDTLTREQYILLLKDLAQRHQERITVYKNCE